MPSPEAVVRRFAPHLQAHVASGQDVAKQRNPDDVPLLAALTDNRYSTALQLSTRQRFQLQGHVFLPH